MLPIPSATQMIQHPQSTMAGYACHARLASLGQARAVHCVALLDCARLLSFGPRPPRPYVFVFSVLFSLVCLSTVLSEV